MKHLNMHLICPFCLIENDKITDLDEDEEPQPFVGAISMCLTCGEFSIFGQDMTLYKPRPFEIAHMDQDPELQKVRASWKETKR